MNRPCLTPGCGKPTAAAPTRPVLRYHGGKWMLAPWIISHFPEHRIYCEPFCGAASVLMRKERARAETINDLDGDIVNLFRVLRDPEQSAWLAHLLELTPWAREEFVASYQTCDDPIERARRTVARCYMGFGTSSRRKGMTGFRARPYRESQSGVTDWTNYPKSIARVTARLRGVRIESRPAVEIIRQCDDETTLFYCDPPYPLGTRSSMRGTGDMGRAYQHEMTDARLEFIQKDDPRLKINRHGIEGVGFYTEQGWGPNVYVPTTSRIDAPARGGDFNEPFRVGQPVEFRGMAHGGDKGISQVEVSTDGGKTYAAADIYAPGTKISWSLWRYAWTPAEVSDDMRVYVRAINGEGERQSEQFRDQVPHGALDLHWVRGRVVDADAPAPKVASVEGPAASLRTALCHRGVWNA